MTRYISNTTRLTADKILQKGSTDDLEIINRGYEVVLGCIATEQEKQQALQFIQLVRPRPQLTEEVGVEKNKKRAWQRLIHILFASTEFQMLN